MRHEVVRQDIVPILAHGLPKSRQRDGGCMTGIVALQCRHENGVSSIRKQRKLHLRGGGRHASAVRRPDQRSSGRATLFRAGSRHPRCPRPQTALAATDTTRATCTRALAMFLETVDVGRKVVGRFGFLEEDEWLDERNARPQQSEGCPR